MNSTIDSSRYKRHAFTLVELMVVVLLMSIVSVTVLPAMGNVQLMREGAARDEVIRFIDVARARALASGEPVGVGVGLQLSSLSMVRVAETGGVQILTDPLTGRQRRVFISAMYSGVTLEGLLHGDGSSGSGMIWFDYEGAPHTRDQFGAFQSLNDAPVEIEMSSSETILVHPHSGFVEVQ